MKGTGPMAWMIGRRFEIACEKLGPQQAPFETDDRSFRQAEAQRTATEFVLIGIASEAIHLATQGKLRFARNDGKGVKMSKKPPTPRFTVITLGVSDMRASIAFYEALGFARKMQATGEAVASSTPAAR
jgi:hypothetical protein